uniref:Uncharacterized protein n=1 Tax=Brassica campestris TaxID=3711 RepID=M4CEJ3_BRACM
MLPLCASGNREKGSPSGEKHFTAVCEMMASSVTLLLWSLLLLGTLSAIQVHFSHDPDIRFRLRSSRVDLKKINDSELLVGSPPLGFYPIFMWIRHISYGCFHIHVDSPHLLWVLPYSCGFATSPMGASIFMWIRHISYGCFHIHVDSPHLLWVLPYSCGFATSPMGASIFMWIRHISYGYLAWTTYPTYFP